MDDEDYTGYWGREGLTLWQAHVLREVEIPEQSKRFLVDVGLPVLERRIGLQRLEWDKMLPYSPANGAFRLVGRNYGDAYLFIQEPTGAVRNVTGAPGFEKLVTANSSIQQYAFCLTAYDRARDLRYDDPMYKEKVDGLCKEFRDIDQIAVDDPESLWSIEILDMRLSGNLGREPMNGALESDS